LLGGVERVVAGPRLARARSAYSLIVGASRPARPGAGDGVGVLSALRGNLQPVRGAEKTRNHAEFARPARESLDSGEVPSERQRGDQWKPKPRPLGGDIKGGPSEALMSDVAAFAGPVT
jgi:hypothetical protein